MKRWLYLILGTLLLVGASNAHAVNYVHENVPATTVFEYTTTLQTGSYVFETTALAPKPGQTGSTPDPVLRIWDETNPSLSNQFEIANDDNGGTGLNAKVTFSIGPNQTRAIRIIIHATSASSGGVATLKQNGVTIVPTVVFGGAVIQVDAELSPNPNNHQYHIESVLTANGSTDTKLFAVGCTSNETLLSINDDGGVGLASRVSGSAICKVVVGSWSQYSEGNTNVYVNDHWTDADYDGLGAGLEAALQTCNDNYGPNCANVLVTMDTDHDGISDHNEVFGYPALGSPQYLPKWGANPRHKDIFIEFDYLENLPGGNQPFGSNETQLVQWLQDIQSYFNVGTASELKNPDGGTGIRLHFDIGINPTDPNHATLFGDWGGSTTNIQLTKDNGDPINWGNTDTINTARNTGVISGVTNNNPIPYQISYRQVRFHYVLVVNGYISNANASVMAFQQGGASIVFAHEMGHTLGIAHWGDNTWGMINCKPNYTSIMNYNFTYTITGKTCLSDNDCSINQFCRNQQCEVGFSQQTGIALNPASVKESDGVGIMLVANTNKNEHDYLSDYPFHLTLASFLPSPQPRYLGVDWSRDGLISSGDRVRAPLTWNECRSGNPNSPSNSQALLDIVNPASKVQTISSDFTSDETTPKTIRVNERMFIFAVGQKDGTSDSRIIYKSSPLGLASSGTSTGKYGGCQADGDRVGSGSVACSTWNNAISIQTDPKLAIQNVTAIWPQASQPDWEQTEVIVAFKAINNDENLPVHEIYECVGTIQPDHSINFGDPVQCNKVNVNVSTSSTAEIDLSWVRVNESSYNQKRWVLGLFFTSDTGKAAWVTKEKSTVNGGVWSAQKDMLFDLGYGIGTAGSRQLVYTGSLANWPGVEVDTARTCYTSKGEYTVTDINGETSTQKTMEVHCLDPTDPNETWKRIEAFNTGKAPLSKYRPGFVFHRPRKADDGTLAQEEGRGHFIFAFTQESYDRLHDTTAFRVYAKMGNPISTSSPPHTATSAILPDWHAVYRTTSTRSGLSLYEDLRVSATKGTLVRSGGIDFLPLADGTYRMDLQGGNDFVLMETNMCFVLRGTSKWPCSRQCSSNNDCPSSAVCTNQMCQW